MSYIPYDELTLRVQALETHITILIAAMIFIILLNIYILRRLIRGTK